MNKHQLPKFVISPPYGLFSSYFPPTPPPKTLLMRSKAALVPYEKSMKIWSMVTKTHNVKILRAKKRFTFFPPLTSYSSAPNFIKSSSLVFPFQGKKKE